MAVSVLPAPALSLPFTRNKIRNGDFSIWQRGGGAHLVDASSVNRYTADGWILTTSGGTIGTAYFGRGGGFVTKYQGLANVVGQSAATDHFVVRHPIESVHTLFAQQATLSFDACLYSGGSGGVANIGVVLRQYFGSGGSPSANVDTLLGTVQVGVNPTRKTFTFNVPTIAGKVLGSSGTDALEIVFVLSAGTSAPAFYAMPGVGIQNGVFGIERVQLEQGNGSTTFEDLPYPLQLEWNRRFFQRRTYPAVNCGVCNGCAWAGNDYYGVFPFSTMRAAPTMSHSGASHFSVWSGGTSGVATSFIFGGVSNEAAEWHIGTGGGPGAGLGVWVRSQVAGAYIDLSAEL